MSFSLQRLADQAGITVQELRGRLNGAGIDDNGHGEIEEARIVGFVRKMIADRKKQS
jgi:hypothetical protein